MSPMNYKRALGSIALLVPPLIIGLIATVLAINLWGPWGIVGGILVTSAAFEAARFSTAMFSSLDDAQLNTISQMGVEKSYRKGDIILMEEDQTNQSFFLIVKGEVKVVLTAEDGAITTPEMQKALAQQLGAKIETLADKAGTTVSLTHATFWIKENRAA